MKSTLNIEILTLFPEMFPGTLGLSIIGNALKEGLWSYNIVNIRDFGIGPHKQVDDIPFGGGYGMVIRPDVLGEAIRKAISNQKDKSNIYYLSPRGKPISNYIIDEILEKKDIIMICGRYEGIDERIIEEYNPTEICVGDVVLSGGEPAAQLVLDACIRKIPGVLGNKNSLLEESFADISNDEILLEYPLYTRPRSWRSREVPNVLLSGNHKKINEWRYDRAIEETKKRRPELLKIKE
jgi:tRNA (guanine37-N1)-methyltransferase